MRVDAPRLALPAAIVAALALAACGQSTDGAPGPGAKPKTSPKRTLVRSAAGGVALTRDPEEGASFPLPAGTRGAKKAPLPGDVPAAPRRKPAPSADGGEEISPGAPSDAEIRRELREMNRALKDFRRRQRQPLAAGVRAGVTSRGRAQTPINAPAVVARVIAGGNAIARFPYVWGGGHGSFVDSGYDCSGSVSYALAAAGLLDTPLTSGQLARWGAPGPGRWITIYANAGHTFMYVAGLRFDTSGRAGPLGSRWQTAPRSLAGFTVRRPPGL